MLPKIAIKNIAKSFGDKKVLTDVNLEVQKGESLVIVGGSGTGKSVLIKIIAGLIKQDSGKIFIDGKVMNNKNKDLILNEFGFLFQSGALFDSLKIWENVSFRLIQNQNATRKEAYKIAIENLSYVGLSEKVANLYPSELSGGMQKRVSLARSIASKPQIIFFDEPTTGLDPIMSNVINELIILNTKKLGATAITITHDLSSASKIADRVAMLYQGSIIWQGDSLSMVKSNNKFVDQFVTGSSNGPIVF
jgi:phospholipid/cholesterol/gamma-HCH transport system ATP-binding protein